MSKIDRLGDLAFLLIALLGLTMICWVGESGRAESYAVSTEGGALNARFAPDGEIIASFENGDALEVLEIKDGWAQINHGGDKLYVSAAYIVKEDKPTGEYIIRANGSVNVREKPGGTRLRKVRPGKTVTVTHWATDDAGCCWACIGDGYVSSDYLEEAEGETE